MKMLKILPLAAAIVAAPGAFAADAAPAATAPVMVAIHNMRFSPARLAIAAGTTVTWVNEDPAPHTVTDRGRVFRSAALDTGERFSYTFKAPGDFTYFCTIHPMMVGEIVVK
jgi:plastocyanin